MFCGSKQTGKHIIPQLPSPVELHSQRKLSFLHPPLQVHAAWDVAGWHPCYHILLLASLRVCVCLVCLQAGLIQGHKQIWDGLCTRLARHTHILHAAWRQTSCWRGMAFPNSLTAWARWCLSSESPSFGLERWPLAHAPVHCGIKKARDIN